MKTEKIDPSYSHRYSDKEMSAYLILLGYDPEGMSKEHVRELFNSYPPPPHMHEAVKEWAGWNPTVL